MGFRLNVIRLASFTASQAALKSAGVPKGYVAVYVGQKQKRFVVPISFLNQPLFQNCYIKQKKNLDMIIPWVASPFLALKMSFNT